MSDQEVTAEFEVQELSGGEPPERPAVFARVTLGAKTDLGRARENNEDKFDWLEPEDDETLAARGRLYAVADGMGGHAAGQVASEVALKTLIRTYFDGDRGSLPAALTEGIRAANTLVWETGSRVPGRNGMGTTITALALHGDKAVIGQVGDSRAYLIREGQIEQITDDHSWVAEQVRANVMTEAEAMLSPYRNIITRSIGAEPEVSPDLFETPVRAGDRFLLCSDGLSGVVEPEEMREIATGHSPSMAAWRLIELANDRGGPDNITCLMLRIDELLPIEEAAPSGTEADRSESAVVPNVSFSPAETDASPSNGPSDTAKPKPKSWFGLKR